MRNRRTSPNLLLAGLALAGLLQANWPQWRGPNRNGSARAAHSLAVNWSRDRFRCLAHEIAKLERGNAHRMGGHHLYYFRRRGLHAAR